MLSDFFPKCSCCGRGSASAPSPVSRLSEITFSVRHRGVFRNLCTTCVLKLHPGLFCPICFQVYGGENPVPVARHRKMCISCPTICHSSCVIPSTTSAAFECPVCKDHSFSFFAAGESDVNLSRQFLAAAKLAKNSIEIFARVARDVADRRAREANVARNEAVEALNQLDVLLAQEMNID